MSKKIRLGVGISLALIAVALVWMANATPVSAQNLDVSVAGQTAPAFETHDDRTVAIVRSDWGGYRPVRQGDNDPGVVSLSEYVALRGGDPTKAQAEFETFRSDNRFECSVTGEWIRESIAIIGEVGEIDAELQGIAFELAELGDAQNRTSWWRRGFTGISGWLLCSMGAARYCYASASSLIGGEIMSSTYDRALKVDKKQSEVNVKQSRLQLRATVLTMRMNIGYAKMMQGYCLIAYPDETIGTATGPAR